LGHVYERSDQSKGSDYAEDDRGLLGLGIQFILLQFPPDWGYGELGASGEDGR